MIKPTLHIVIPGECPPAPRPRFTVTPTRSFAQAIQSRSMKALMGCFRPSPYTPKGSPYATWKKAAAWDMDAARRSHCGTSPFVPKNAPVEVSLLFVSALPKSKERKTIQVLRDWCVSLRKGDADNLAKGPLDAAKGIIWHDDTQVASLRIEKVVGAQGELPRTEMMVRALDRVMSSATDFERTRKAILGLSLAAPPEPMEENERCRTTKGRLPF